MLWVAQQGVTVFVSHVGIGPCASPAGSSNGPAASVSARPHICSLPFVPILEYSCTAALTPRPHPSSPSIYIASPSPVTLLPTEQT